MEYEAFKCQFMKSKRQDTTPYAKLVPNHLEAKLTKNNKTTIKFCSAEHYDTDNAKVLSGDKYNNNLQSRKTKSYLV